MKVTMKIKSVLITGLCVLATASMSAEQPSPSAKQASSGRYRLVGCESHAACEKVLLPGKDSDAAKFAAIKFPVLPILTTNTNPELCETVFDQAKKVYFSRQTSLSLYAPQLFNHLDTNQFQFVNWNNIEGKDYRVKLLSIDISGNGEISKLLYQAQSHGWGYEYFLSLVPSEFQLGSESDFDKFPSIYSSYHEPKLFRWKEKYYLYDDPDVSRMVDGIPLTFESLEINSLTVSGKLESQCKIEFSNNADDFRDLRIIPEIGALLSALTAISGTGEGELGSLHSESWNYRSAINAAFRITNRPWAVALYDRERISRDTYHVFNDRMTAFVNDWGMLNGWNRRESLTLPNFIYSAKVAARSYLEKRFGVPSKASEEKASQIIEDLTASFIQVPSSYYPGDDLYSVERDNLVDALMIRSKEKLMGVLDGKIAYWNESGWQEHPLTRVEMAEKHLQDSIAWNFGLNELLKTKVDVNFRNEFGKTALMAASHMNRPDATRLLLQNAANPNLSTKACEYDCGVLYSVSVRIGGRTALMYAAENSGIEVMRLLIEAGADTNAKDSKGGGIDDYLIKNERFTMAEKKMGVVALVKKYGAQQSVPGFECRRALTRIENLICRDEVLRMLDREIGSAFSRLKPLTHTDITASQKRWLKARDRQCNQADEEQVIGCLQDELTARERFLHVLLQAYQNLFSLRNSS